MLSSLFGRYTLLDVDKKFVETRSHLHCRRSVPLEQTRIFCTQCHAMHAHFSRKKARQTDTEKTDARDNKEPEVVQTARNFWAWRENCMRELPATDTVFSKHKTCRIQNKWNTKGQAEIRLDIQSDKRGQCKMLVTRTPGISIQLFFRLRSAAPLKTVMQKVGNDVRDGNVRYE